jgi:hypothetical protein
MHHLLYSYKNGPEQLRGRLLPRVAALLARFLQNHGACIGARDTITIVPSSKGRPGLHPLMQALMMVRDLASDTEDLLRPGSQPAGHLIARDESFTAVTRLDGQRVLLVDDTFTTTTGAEIQSAASALQLAGAIIPAAVVIGRFINPGFSESAQRLWERAEARPFNFDACCLCDAPWT